jgi:hypothetical protein
MRARFAGVWGAGFDPLFDPLIDPQKAKSQTELR